MNHNFPDSEINGERIIYISVELPQYGGSTAKVTASVQRRAVSHRVDPDSETGRVIYGDDEKATGYRNCSWSASKKNALFVEHLHFDGIFDLDNEDKPYTVAPRYRDVYAVEKHDAKHMFKTLDKIENEQTKLDQKLGYCGSFAQYIVRMGLILGIKTFAVKREDGNKSTWLDKVEYHEFGATSVESNVQRLIDKARGKVN